MHVTDDQVKTTILSQFASDTKLRVVIATSAFGLGNDAHCVIETIHDAPSTVRRIRAAIRSYSTRWKCWTVNLVKTQ